MVIIDGAHNPGAARELKQSLELYFPGKKLYFVMGMFKDKDYDQVIGMTAPLAQHIITVETPNNPRALPAQELAAAVAKVNPSVEAADSIAPRRWKRPWPWPGKRTRSSSSALCPSWARPLTL